MVKSKALETLRLMALGCITARQREALEMAIEVLEKDDEED